MSFPTVRSCKKYLPLLSGQTFLNNFGSLSKNCTVNRLSVRERMDTGKFIRKLADIQQQEQDTCTLEEVIEDLDCSVVQGEEIIKQIDRPYDPNNPGLDECSPKKGSGKRKRTHESRRQPSDEEVSEEEELTTTTDQILPEPPLTVMTSEADQQPARKKVRTDPTALLTLGAVLMSLGTIRIEKYGAAYQKFKDSPGKISKDVRSFLFQILQYWGTICQTASGTESLNEYLEQDPGNSLYTILCPSRAKTQLSNWLKEFVNTKENASRTSGTGIRGSSLSAYMLPSPPVSRLTSTSFTTADGRVRPAAALASPDYQGHQGLLGGPGSSILYQPRTSGLLRSMSWRDITYQYTLRSKANSGSLCVKLEVYRWKNVAGLPSGDWWKNADCRAFILCNEEDRVGTSAETLRQAMQAHMEGQDDVEAEYILKK